MANDHSNRNELVLHQEELAVEKSTRRIGAARVRKVVESEPVESSVSLLREHADVVRVPPHDDETGEVETLPDGSVSIPVLGEELVVTTRVVVLERLVVSRSTVEEHRPVHAELRRERAEVEILDER